MHTHKVSLPDEMRSRILAVHGSIPEYFLFVNSTVQTLDIIHHGTAVASYAISTSKYGIGNREGSYKTPAGIHRIAEKIGGTAPARTIFKDRKDTGNVWSAEIEDEDNLILTRILRLEGLEPGINRGPSIDSYERYIYIHGTNKESCIGTPVSHGCICMKNDDIIELFNRVPEHTLVVIT
jgi:hypothetical protein